MNRRNVLSMLSQAEKKHYLSEIKFSYEPDKSYNCFILSHSHELFLCVPVSDFTPDGFAVLCVSDIESISNKGDGYSHINELLDPVSDIPIPFIDLTSWKTVLASPLFARRVINLEGFTGDGVDDDFYVYGKLLELRSEGFSFAYFDLNGKWDKPFEFYYNDLSALYWDSKYDNVWQKRLTENRVCGMTSTKDDQSYTHLGRFFDALGGAQNDYNWLLTECETNCGELNEQFTSDHLFITGAELTELINKYNDPQWIWAAISAFDKAIPEDEVLRYGLPSTEDKTISGVYPSMLHPLAVMEIIPFDSSYFIFRSNNKELFDKVSAAYPKCGIMSIPELDTIE